MPGGRSADVTAIQGGDQHLCQAGVIDETDIVCLELDGKREEVKAAIAWMEKQGITVEPVEISVIES